MTEPSPLIEIHMSKGRLVAAGMTAMLVALTLSGCIPLAPKPKPTPKPLEAVGTVSVPMNATDLLNGTYTNAQGAACGAGDGYDDISSDAQVVVTDASGKTVGVGVLQPGTLEPGPQGTAFDARCSFAFDILKIPAGSKYYGVHVGNQNRGTVQYTKDQLKDIQLTIGG
ncbi:hypothetical protein GCM10027568_10970 [Humibacter soli]